MRLWQKYDVRQSFAYIYDMNKSTEKRFVYDAVRALGGEGANRARANLVRTRRVFQIAALCGTASTITIMTTVQAVKW